MTDLARNRRWSEAATSWARRYRERTRTPDSVGHCRTLSATTAAAGLRIRKRNDLVLFILSLAINKGVRHELEVLAEAAFGPEAEPPFRHARGHHGAGSGVHLVMEKLEERVVPSIFLSTTLYPHEMVRQEMRGNSYIKPLTGKNVSRENRLVEKPLSIIDIFQQPAARE